MPHSLVDDPKTFPAVVVPDPKDPGNAASVEAPFQVLANRTANLSARMGGGAASNGIVRVQLAVDVPALRAFTMHADGDITRVPGIGFYEYRANLGDIDDGLRLIKPNDVLNAGKWVLVGPVGVHVRFSVADLRFVTVHTNQDLACIRGLGLYEFRSDALLADDGMRVVRPNDIADTTPGRWILTGPYRTLALESYEDASTPLTSIAGSASETFVDTPQAVQIATALAKGDVVDAHGRFLVSAGLSTSAATTGEWVVSVREGGSSATPIDIPCTLHRVASAANTITSAVVPFSFRRVVATSGFWSVTLRMRRVTGNGSVDVLSRGSMVVHAYRP